MQNNTIDKGYHNLKTHVRNIKQVKLKWSLWTFFQPFCNFGVLFHCAHHFGQSRKVFHKIAAKSFENRSEIVDRYISVSHFLNKNAFGGKTKWKYLEFLLKEILTLDTKKSFFPFILSNSPKCGIMNFENAFSIFSFCKIPQDLYIYLLYKINQRYKDKVLESEIKFLVSLIFHWKLIFNYFSLIFYTKNEI